MGSDRIRQEVEKWHWAPVSAWHYVSRNDLERLIARLTAAWEEERQHWQQIHTGCHAEREELQAQVAALTKALRGLLGAVESGGVICGLCGGGPEPDSPTYEGHNTLCPAADAHHALATVRDGGT